MGVPRLLKPFRAFFADGDMICCKLTIGATGAVAGVKGYGVESITRDSQGVYSMVLEDPHAALVGASIMEVGTKVDLTYQITAEDVDNTTKASRKVTFVAKAASTATDPASGSVILIMLVFADNKGLGFGPERVS